MRLKSTLAVISVISVAVALGLASQSPAEAGWCRAPRGFCGPQPVRHYIYYPQYQNIYYMAQFPTAPYPNVYIPRGYWPYYQRPYAWYGRGYWAPRWNRAAYAVPAPIPVPVEGRCDGCGEDYLK